MDGSEILDTIEPQFFFKQQHSGYVNSISLDNTERRLLLCGGADSAISIWDIDSPADVDVEDETLGPDSRETIPWVDKNIHSTPLCKIKPKSAHQYGISKIEWWPFNNDMFFTGSYDSTVKVWDSEELEEVYSFNMDNKVYCFDINPIEEDGLVAVGLDHPLIRLVDLRIGGAAQSFAGHTSGSVCSVKWSPSREYMLASGGSDGTLRIWDIRQAKAQVACMDMHRTNVEQRLTSLEFRKSHRGICNGLVWHPSGDEILSTGLDNKVRIWDLTGEPGGGTNKSVNFGPLFQDRRQQNMDPCMSFQGDIENCFANDQQEEFYVLLPSDTGDILMSQYSDGRLVRRLTPPGREIRTNRQSSIIARAPKSYEFFSTTCDGSVLCWRSPLVAERNDNEDKLKNITEEQD